MSRTFNSEISSYFLLENSPNNSNLMNLKASKKLLKGEQPLVCARSPYSTQLGFQMFANTQTIYIVHAFLFLFTIATQTPKMNAFLSSVYTSIYASFNRLSFSEMFSFVVRLGTDWRCRYAPDNTRLKNQFPLPYTTGVFFFNENKSETTWFKKNKYTSLDFDDF